MYIWSQTLNFSSRNGRSSGSSQLHQNPDPNRRVIREPDSRNLSTFFFFFLLLSETGSGFKFVLDQGAPHWTTLDGFPSRSSNSFFLFRLGSSSLFRSVWFGPGRIVASLNRQLGFVFVLPLQSITNDLKEKPGGGGESFVFKMIFVAYGAFFPETKCLIRASKISPPVLKSEHGIFDLKIFSHQKCLILLISF